MDSNKYEGWKINELKAELKRRGAKLTGKKKDLQDRLIYYDRNNNFYNSDGESASGVVDNCFPTPASNLFKDINSDTVLPPLSKQHILTYLERFSVHKDIGKEMYESYYLVNARVAADDNYFYIRGQCKAQMRKHTQYFVNICLSLYGSIEGAHCECAVGSGMTSHCKHVAVVLWGIEHMNRKKKIIMCQVGTQKLQSFYKPQRDYTGTPLKADELKHHTVHRSDDVFFEPADLKNTTPEMYRDRVRNIVINYSSTNMNTAVSYKKALMPANTYGVIWDHKYAKISIEEQVLFNLKLIDVDMNDILQIERITRLQARSPEWHEFRRHRLTASFFYRICHVVSDPAKKALVNRILHSKELKTKETEHGKLNEGRALAYFEKAYKETVQACGLVVHADYPFIAASPDGFIGEDTLVEVKCPYNQRFSTITGDTIPFLRTREDGSLYLDPKHPYYYQIQGQLYVTNRSHALLVVFTYVELCVVPVPRDEIHISLMFCYLHHFYEQHFEPAILEEYVYKNYGAVFFK